MAFRLGMYPNTFLSDIDPAVGNVLTQFKSKWAESEEETSTAKLLSSAKNVDPDAADKPVADKVTADKAGAAAPAPAAPSAQPGFVPNLPPSHPPVRGPQFQIQ